ncbi:MAG: hypothetical protein AB7I41_22390 [Candidatus Sericytochromatia bacterium]
MFLIIACISLLPAIFFIWGYLPLIQELGWRFFIEGHLTGLPALQFIPNLIVSLWLFSILSFFTFFAIKKKMRIGSYSGLLVLSIVGMQSVFSLKIDLFGSIVPLITLASACFYAWIMIEDIKASEKTNEAN